MSTLYTIRDWAENYESADNRKTDGPLKWYAARTKMNGLGFVRITQEKDAANLFCAWNLLLMVAADQNRAERGNLARGGIPLTPDDLELITRFPAKMFERALEFFSSERIGWISALSDSVRGAPDKSGEIRTDSDNSGQCPENAGQIRTTLHYTTLHDTTLSQCDSLPLTHTDEGSKPAEVAEKQPKQTDSEWIASLKASPAYAGVDVEREIEKCRVWCDNKGRKASRARIINWLNRAEVTIQAGGTPKQGLFR